MHRISVFCLLTSVVLVGTAVVDEFLYLCSEGMDNEVHALMLLNSFPVDVLLDCLINIAAPELKKVRM